MGIDACHTRTAVSRRTVLASAVALTTGGLAACAGTERAAPVAPTVSEPTPQGPHQPGILTPPPAAAMVTAVELRATDRAGLTGALRAITEIVATADDVEVTVAVGGSLFDHRFGLAAVRPRRLSAMPSFPNDALEPALCHGDLLVQAGGPDAASVTAVTERVTAAAGRRRWQVSGAHRDRAETVTGRHTERNLFGFREGAGNPDVTDAAEMDRVLWAGPDEPAWTAGGTYQVIRLIRFATQLWAAEPTARQEAIFGRTRDGDVPLGHRYETDQIDYGTDQGGRLIPLDAHIRRANPRTADTADSAMLRRGFTYDRGPADQGLVFVCFQQDLERSFATVQRRLTGAALDRYVLPVGGGYFFALPGVSADPADHLGRGLVTT
ncbi:Dyp-type peroxidase [Krasilnikovia sp. MM14-A1259]|uniref:Dyp-type peroxidase n=1 Tax=Krasilnikovia sp. MM14-A1259 TaxID=3373539 RepID=UPI0037FB84A6